MVDTTTSAFTHDIFGGSQSDLITQLTADRNDANSMNRAIAAAKKKGLSGEFAAYLEQSGNINLAQQIAGDSGAQIKSIEDLYASRGSSVAATAKQAGNFFVPEIKTLTTQQAKLDHTLNHLESAIEDLAHRVESGAAKGTAKGSEKGTSHNRARAAATRRAGRA